MDITDWWSLTHAHMHTTLYSKLTIVWNGCQFCWYHDTDCIAESVHTMKPTKIKTNSHFKKMIYNTKGTENWLARLKDTVRHCHRKPAPGTKEQGSVMNRWFSDEPVVQRWTGGSVTLSESVLDRFYCTWDRVASPASGLWWWISLFSHPPSLLRCRCCPNAGKQTAQWTDQRPKRLKITKMNSF